MRSAIARAARKPGRKNLQRRLMIYAGRWRPVDAHPVICHQHARERLSRDRVAGLKIYDDRERRSRVSTTERSASDVLRSSTLRRLV